MFKLLISLILLASLAVAGPDTHTRHAPPQDEAKFDSSAITFAEPEFLDDGQSLTMTMSSVSFGPPFLLRENLCASVPGQYTFCLLKAFPPTQWANARRLQ